jgi:hypothetical protein
MIELISIDPIQSSLITVGHLRLDDRCATGAERPRVPRPEVFSSFSSSSSSSWPFGWAMSAAC